MSVEERFIKYVKIDTQSDESSETVPSTMKQKDLGNLLVEELKELGIDNAHMDEYGSVYAHIPSNDEHSHDRIGFIAHMDTATDASGTNVKPRIIKDYDGLDIELNPDMMMTKKQFPVLNKYVHHDLIVTDGTTLLGGDDKAGIAIIMDMAERIMKSDMKHGDIAIAFTCDEEIGRGADHFDLKTFNCDYAYTVDGGPIEAVDYENFNAAAARVTITGVSVHPGDAKNKMINASLVGFEFHQCLNEFENPAYTCGYDGFNHLLGIEGRCEKAELAYIIRNHDKALLEKQKQEFMDAKEFLNKKYGYNLVHVEIIDQYENMRSIIEKDMRCVEKAKQAISNVGLTPVSNAIRGGTDGAMLTYKGLNCPNLGTGGENCHGPYEFVSINNMNKMVDIVVEIIKLA